VRSYEFDGSIEDTVLPQTNSNVIPAPNAAGWSHAPVEVVLMATDDYEVASIDYTLSNAVVSSDLFSPLNPLSIPLSEGRWMLTYYATDVHHNVELPQTLEARVDGTPPQTDISLSGLRVGSGGFLFDVKVTLTAADPALEDGSSGSGVDRIEYSLDDGTSWQAYIEPFVIRKPGKTILHYRAVDLADNVEEAQRAEIQQWITMWILVMAIIVVIISVILVVLLLVRRRSRRTSDVARGSEVV
jgi:hypothetical protein